MDGGDVVCQLGDIAAYGFLLERPQIPGEYPAQQFLPDTAGDRGVDAGKDVAPRPLQQENRKKDAAASCQQPGNLGSGLWVDEPLDDIGLVRREKRQRQGNQHKKSTPLPLFGKKDVHEITRPFLSA